MFIYPHGEHHSLHTVPLIVVKSPSHTNAFYSIDCPKNEFASVTRYSCAGKSWNVFILKSDAIFNALR